MGEPRDTDMGATLTQWREQFGMTKARLSQLLGLSPDRLADWEREGVPAGLSVLVERAMCDVARFQARRGADDQPH